MTRLTAKDFQPEVLELFDHYVHGELSRRGFLDHAARLTGSAAAAAGLLTALSPVCTGTTSRAHRCAHRHTRTNFCIPQGHDQVSG